MKHICNLHPQLSLSLGFCQEAPQRHHLVRNSEVRIA